MYTLKPYFFAMTDVWNVKNILHKYPDLKLDEKAMILSDSAKNVAIVELKDSSDAKLLAKELVHCPKEFWQEPEQLDFAHVMPQCVCNSFVLVAYGHYDDLKNLAEKWKTYSAKYAQKLYPVLISFQKNEKAAWVEFRGHSDLPDEKWFDDIRKISKVFTKSSPTFYRAEKIIR